MRAQCHPLTMPHHERVLSGHGSLSHPDDSIKADTPHFPNSQVQIAVLSFGQCLETLLASFPIAHGAFFFSHNATWRWFLNAPPCSSDINLVRAKHVVVLVRTLEVGAYPGAHFLVLLEQRAGFCHMESLVSY